MAVPEMKEWPNECETITLSGPLNCSSHKAVFYQKHEGAVVCDTSMTKPRPRQSSLLFSINHGSVLSTVKQDYGPSSRGLPIG